MIEFVQNETKRLLINCCTRYAKQKGLDIENVQLVLGINEEGNTYTLCENYTPKEEYDIMQVLGVRVDFLGYSRLAPPFIIKSLVRFAERHNIPYKDVKILCVPVKEEKINLELFLYHGFSEYVETITLSELFNEEDMEMPNLET